MDIGFHIHIGFDVIAPTEVRIWDPCHLDLPEILTVFYTDDGLELAALSSEQAPKSDGLSGHPATSSCVALVPSRSPDSSAIELGGALRTLLGLGDIGDRGG